MSRASLRLLDRLEREVVASVGKVHLIFGRDPGELVQKEAKLLASAEWHDGDSIVGVR